MDLQSLSAPCLPFSDIRTADLTVFGSVPAGSGENLYERINFAVIVPSEKEGYD
jgi:hypothetical protein